jgi:aldose 1-epimerase
MALENLEARPVPGGIGLHPFFVRDADSELSCQAGTVWRMDGEVLPLELIPVPPDWDFSSGRKVNDVVLDTAF